MKNIRLSQLSIALKRDARYVGELATSDPPAERTVYPLKESFDENRTALPSPGHHPHWRIVFAVCTESLSGTWNYRYRGLSRESQTAVGMVTAFAKSAYQRD